MANERVEALRAKLAAAKAGTAPAVNPPETAAALVETEKEVASTLPVAAPEPKAEPAPAEAPKAAEPAPQEAERIETTIAPPTPITKGRKPKADAHLTVNAPATVGGLDACFATLAAQAKELSAEIHVTISFPGDA